MLAARVKTSGACKPREYYPCKEEVSPIFALVAGLKVISRYHYKSPNNQDKKEGHLLLRGF